MIPPVTSLASQGPLPLSPGSAHPPWLPLTTEPHDEHHLGGDFVISEEVQQVGQREDVDSSAEQHQHLPMSTSPV